MLVAAAAKISPLAGEAAKFMMNELLERVRRQEGEEGPGATGGAGMGGGMGGVDQTSNSLLYQWANVLTHATLQRPEPPQLLFSSSLPVLLPTQHLYRNSTVAVPRPNSIISLLISGHQMMAENKFAEAMQRCG